MERLVNRRLIDYLTKHKKLDNRQLAFCPGTGTNSYFATQGEILAGAKANNQHVEIVGLDLEKAYNRTWTPLVLKTLTDWGICGNMLAFIQGFLSNRTFDVLVGGIVQGHVGKKLPYHRFPS